MGDNLHVKINALTIIVVTTIAGIEDLLLPTLLYESSPSLSLDFAPSLTPLLSQSPSPTPEINGELSSKLMYICE